MVLGEDLGLFHAAGLVGAVLLEELEAVIHMGTEGAGGFADIGGVFYGDDGDLVGGAFGGVDDEVISDLILGQRGDVREVFLGIFHITGDGSHTIPQGSSGHHVDAK